MVSSDDALQIGEPAVQVLDPIVGLGGLDDDRAAGVSPLKDNGAQFPHHLFHPFHPAGVSNVEGIFHGGLGQGRLWRGHGAKQA